jgi:glycosidase
MCLCATNLSSVAQDAPEILKVEPPNWWTNHSINPVRVLIRGKNLAGAHVEVIGTGMRIASAPRINQAGTYLFVDVSIEKGALSGARTLRITTAHGKVDAPFNILTPLARGGRFQGFSPDDVIYLIMPDRFADGDPTNNDPLQSRGLYNRAKPRFYHGGDFQGIINHLPYLKDLGITAIWLNPWYDNVNYLNRREMYPDTPAGEKQPITDYHGYGAVDFYGVEEHFGTLAKLHELVDRAHALGIKVIQDEVCNHTGPYHPWVTDEPMPDWYNGTLANHLANPFQPWMLQDPRAAYEAKRATLEGWFVDILPDLNQNNAEVARYEIQNTLWWIGVTGLDGIRQDTLPYVPRQFWREWMRAIKREYPRLRVVGEMYDGDPALVSFFQGGRMQFDGIDSGVDTLFDFPLLYPVRRAFAEGKALKEVAQMLARDHLYPNSDVLVTFIGNHDMLRFMNEPGANTIGLKLAYTFIMTTRGTPQLYYGDEIAMHGASDPDNRRDFPGGFPRDAQDAFTREGRSAEQQDVFDHVRRLAHLRAELFPLRRGRLVNLYVADQQYAYARMTDRESVIIAFNNDTAPASFAFDAVPVKLSDGVRLTDRLSTATDARVINGKIRVTLPARSACILTKG